MTIRSSPWACRNGPRRSSGVVSWGGGTVVPGSEGTGGAAVVEVMGTTPAAATAWKKVRRRMVLMGGPSSPRGLAARCRGRGRPRRAAAGAPVGLEQRGQPLHDVGPLRVEVVRLRRV